MIVTQEQKELVLSYVKSGMSVPVLFKERKDEIGFGIDKFYTLLGEDESFTEAYVRAREVRGHKIFDEIDDVMRDVSSGNMDYQVGRLMIDTLKWKAGKMNKAYSEKQEIDVNVNSDYSTALAAAADRVRKQSEEQDDS